MSRKFDEHFENFVDIDGVLYELIEPKRFDEFAEALMVVKTIEQKINTLQHDEDNSYYLEMLEIQEDHIIDYVDAIGKFDNSILADNIAYLTKTNGISMGDLEKYLDISPGYISRTIGPESKKRLSIDVVWKISKLFDKDIRTMLEINLRKSRNNTELLLKFVEKLYLETVDGKYHWRDKGGITMDVHEKYVRNGLFFNNGLEDTLYTASHLRKDRNWIVKDDVFCKENFGKGKDLMR